MDIAEDIAKQFREQQQKYAYYLIALCVAGIGFAVLKTFDLPLKKSQIPLGMAVFSWGLSILTGLRFITITISSLYTNKTLLEVRQGVHPLSGMHPEKIKIANETLLEGLQRNSKSAVRNASCQQRFFYLGMLLFVVWHVYEMYLRSLSNK